MGKTYVTNIIKITVTGTYRGICCMNLSGEYIHVYAWLFYRRL